jgi:hypothetical protein
VHLCIR